MGTFHNLRLYTWPRPGNTAESMDALGGITTGLSLNCLLSGSASVSCAWHTEGKSRQESTIKRQAGLACCWICSFDILNEKPETNFRTVYIDLHKSDDNAYFLSSDKILSSSVSSLKCREIVPLPFLPDFSCTLQSYR